MKNLHNARIQPLLKQPSHLKNTTPLDFIGLVTPGTLVVRAPNNVAGKECSYFLRAVFHILVGDNFLPDP